MDYQNKQKIINIILVLLLVTAAYYLGANSSRVANSSTLPEIKQPISQNNMKNSSKNNITATARTLTPEEASAAKISSEYYNYITYCIRSNWKNPINDNSQHAALQFNLSKDGKLLAYDVLQSSPSDVYTKAAIRALLNSAPFEPFPKVLEKDIMSFQVHFNGNYLNIGSYANVQRLAYPVNQTNKPVRIKIKEAKRIRTMNSHSGNVPNNTTWNVATQIQYSWLPPLDVNSSVEVSFKVMKSGMIRDIKFIKKSYNDEADKAAFDAIKSVKIKPFSYDKDGFDMRYWFYVEDYNR